MSRSDDLPRIRVLTEREKSTLCYSIFKHSYLARIDLSNAELRGAVFEHSSLVGVDFSGADLRGTTFRACDLRHARFERCRWGANVFMGSLFSRSSTLGGAQVKDISSLGGYFVTTSATDEIIRDGQLREFSNVCSLRRRV